MRTTLRWLSTIGICTPVAVGLSPGCSQGGGTGTACGTLQIADCWTGPFNLQPDFFAAVPTQSSGALQIRIQNGGGIETFSDGIAILIDDIANVQLGQTTIVSLPVGVAPPGVPIVANPTPPNVHATLYLQKSCRTQNLALYALAAVALNPDGSCGAPGSGEPNTCPLPAPTGTLTSDGATPLTIDASVDGGPAAVSAPIGVSTIVFDKLFDGDPNESDADKRLTDVPDFNLYFADPRDTPLGPPPCLGHLVGNFKFYFERGQPEQPYP